MVSSEVARPQFGVLLRQRRLLAGLSQDALAEGSRISVQAVSALERGVRFAPRPDTLALLVKMLDLADTEREEFERVAKASVKKRVRNAERAIDGSRSVAAWDGPVFGDAYFGRESARSEIVRALRTDRCVTIWGPGGVGKTRLVVETLRDARSDTDAEIVFVSLAAAIDDDAVAATVAEALGLKDVPSRDIVSSILAEVGDRRTLLVLDNCEHVIAGVSSFVETLLARTTSVTIVATSRERLRVTGERVVQIGPLEQADAIRLFGDRANLSQADSAAIATICRRLDGVPLALELAAARVPSLGLANVERALDERFALLMRGRRTDAARQQTLRATIAWSYALLSRVERIVFERVALINGRFSLEDAIAVSCDGAIERWDVVDAIAGLIEKAMLSVVEGDDRFERPYLLLESTHAFAMELGDEERADRDLHASRRRLGEYLLDGVRSEQPYSDTDPRTFAGIDLDTVRGFLHWAIVEGHDPELGTRLTGFLGHFWDRRGRYREGLRWTEAALETLPETARDPDQRVRIQRCAAMLYMRIGRFGVALEILKAAYTLAKRCGDRSLYLWMTIAVAKCAALMQETGFARERAEEAAALFEEIGDESERPQIMIMEAVVAGNARDFTRAREVWLRLISLLDASADDSAQRRIRNQALADLAEIEYALGNVRQAAVIGRRNVEMFTGASAALRALALTNLCVYLVCEGSFEEAGLYARRGFELAREIGSTLYIAVLAQALAMMALYRGERAETGAEIFGWASRLFDAGGLDVYDAMTRERLKTLLNAALTPEDLAASMQRGAILRKDDIVELALSLIH